MRSFMKVHIILIIACVIILSENSIYSNSDAEASSPKHKYVTKRIVLGTFNANEIKSNQDDSYKNIKWISMNRNGLSVDDLGSIYVKNMDKIFVYCNNGNIVKEINLNKQYVDKLSDSIEISSDGKTILVKTKETANKGYYVFSADGIFQTILKENTIFRIGCNDIYRAETYSKGLIQEMYVLNRNFERVKDLQAYYLPKVKLNEKPLGFFDNNFNFYYMWYGPEIVKLGPNGNILWKRKVKFNAENWRLIGIDGNSNLYALVYKSNRVSQIVKIDSNQQVVAIISLAQIQKGIDSVNSIDGDGSEINNFLVSCSGDIYFIPNHMDAINPKYKEAYKAYLKNGEYAVYKFELLK